MPRHRTPLEKAAGRLVSAVQKEWILDMGDAGGPVSQSVLEQAHLLLQAARSGELPALLGARSIEQYLGELWVRRHLAVRKAAQALQTELQSGQR